MTPSFPRISIVTPSYNQGEFLEKTILSVCSQNYPDLQYVVIDGGSDDNSLEIIQRHQHKLDYWISEKDDGHADALNKGFAKTDGDIMAWINSDDMYTPWALQTVAEIFDTFPDIEWISGFNSLWNDQGVMIQASRGQKNIYDYLDGDYRWIQQESVFWRRSLWEKAGGYISTDYELMIDGELWSRFFQHAELYSVDAVLGGYRVHQSNRAGSNDQKCREEMKHILENMRKQLPDRTVKVAKNVNIVQKISLISKQSRIFKLLTRDVAPIHREHNYRNIRYINGMWQPAVLKRRT